MYPYPPSQMSSGAAAGSYGIPRQAQPPQSTAGVSADGASGSNVSPSHQHQQVMAPSAAQAQALAAQQAAVAQQYYAAPYSQFQPSYYYPMPGQEPQEGGSGNSSNTAGATPATLGSQAGGTTVPQPYPSQQPGMYSYATPYTGQYPQYRPNPIPNDYYYMMMQAQQAQHAQQQSAAAAAAAAAAGGGGANGMPPLGQMGLGQSQAMHAPAVPQTSHPNTTPSTPAQNTPNHRPTTFTQISAIPATMVVTDPSGQTPPPGIKPKVTTSLWEDEGTICYQVEARGFCVARREDNDMINGTKLLNVAGMTRGRRDGLLKGERNRHVVKAGAMHLKGVWIPYERALDFANKERIVDLLYPLFVTDIKNVLYHPMSHEIRSGGGAGRSQLPGEMPSHLAARPPPPTSQPPQQSLSSQPSQQSYGAMPTVRQQPLPQHSAPSVQLPPPQRQVQPLSDGRGHDRKPSIKDDYAPYDPHAGYYSHYNGGNYAYEPQKREED